jgi:hypothetical protein
VAANDGAAGHQEAKPRRGIYSIGHVVALSLTVLAIFDLTLTFLGRGEEIRHWIEIVLGGDVVLSGLAAIFHIYVNEKIAQFFELSTLIFYLWLCFKKSACLNRWSKNWYGMNSEDKAVVVLFSFFTLIFFGVILFPNYVAGYERYSLSAVIPEASGKSPVEQQRQEEEASGSPSYASGSGISAALSSKIALAIDSAALTADFSKPIHQNAPSPRRGPPAIKAESPPVQARPAEASQPIAPPSSISVPPQIAAIPDSDTGQAARTVSFKRYPSN